MYEREKQAGSVHETALVAVARGESETDADIERKRPEKKRKGENELSAHHSLFYSRHLCINKV